MIEDLDGAEGGPSRRAHTRIVSVALVVATLVGWAAASSPILQGPFATPDPNPLAVAVLTPKEPTVVEHLTVSRSDAIFCSPITQVAMPQSFDASRPLSPERTAPSVPLTTTVYSQDGKSVVAYVGIGTQEQVIGRACTSGEVRTSFDRFAR